MAYSVFGDVRMRCVTDIADADITTMIAESDAWLDLKLDMGALTVPMKRGLSATRTAIMCYLKDPDKESLGEHRMDRSGALKKLNEELAMMMKTAGGGISFQAPYEPFV